MIPEFDSATGRLPPGIHEATWDEIADRFATGERRSRLCRGLETALQILRAAGAEYAYLGGSFVTAKAEPGDYDGCFDDSETFDWDRLAELASRLPARLPGHLTPESARVTAPDGGSGRTYLELFQNDTRIRIVTGVVYLRLDSMPQPIPGSLAWWVVAWSSA